MGNKGSVAAGEPSSATETAGSAIRLFRSVVVGWDMVRLSTGVLFVGIVLLFTPIPPVATILGIVTILVGLGLRVLLDK